MSWKYKVCKLHQNKKTYTVVSRHYSRIEAEISKRGFSAFGRDKTYFIKRYSDKEN